MKTKKTCKREDGVLYCIERNVKNRWISTATVSSVREVLEDILLVNYMSPINRIAEYRRVEEPVDVKLAS